MNSKLMGETMSDDPLSVAVEQVRFMRARGMSAAQIAAAIGAPLPVEGGWDALVWEYGRRAYELAGNRRAAA